MKKLIAVDIDDTLTNETCWTDGDCLRATPRKDIIEKIDKLYRNNFIILYTARRDHLIPATFEWLRRHNVRWHAFSNQKMPADYYIDDKAVHRDAVDNALADEL